MGLKKDEDAILADLYDSEAWKVFSKKYLENDKLKLATSAMALLEKDEAASAITMARYQGAAQRLTYIAKKMRDNYLEERKKNSDWELETWVTVSSSQSKTG